MLILALTAGVLLAELGRALRSDAVARASERPGLTTEAEALIRAWYAEVNRAIKGDDRAGFDRLLTPDFVDHTLAPDASAGADDLAAYLFELRVTHPNAQLVPDELAAAGDRVMVRVDTEEAEQGHFLGIPVDGVRIWGMVDTFRIEGGKIAEHWGDGEPLASFATLATVSAAGPATEAESVTLERHFYPAGATETIALVDGFVLILVESGTMRVAPEDVAAGQASRIAAGSTLPPIPLGAGERAFLHLGDALLLEGSGAWMLANGEDANAATLLVRVQSEMLSGRTPKSGSSGAIVGGLAQASPVAKSSTGVEVALLAGGQQIPLPDGDLLLSFGRMLLPNGRLGLHPVRGAELVGVRTGTLLVDARPGGAWVNSGPGTLVSILKTSLIEAGGGSLVPCCDEVGYDSLGDRPTTVLLVSITPVAAGPRDER